MKDFSIILIRRRRFQSILNRYSLFFSIFSLLPCFLLISVPIYVLFKVFFVFILIIFMLITFFLPLLNEDFKNMLSNIVESDASSQFIKDILISTYYLPMILIIISLVFLLFSIIIAFKNNKYKNFKSGLIGPIIMAIIGIIFCIVYYSCFNSLIGGIN